MIISSIQAIFNLRNIIEFEQLIFFIIIVLLYLRKNQIISVITIGILPSIINIYLILTEFLRIPNITILYWPFIILISILTIQISIYIYLIYTLNTNRYFKNEISKSEINAEIYIKQYKSLYSKEEIRNGLINAEISIDDAENYLNKYF